jgi:hypothetical protein
MKVGKMVYNYEVERQKGKHANDTIICFPLEKETKDSFNQFVILKVS